MHSMPLRSRLLPALLPLAIVAGALAWSAGSGLAQPFAAQQEPVQLLVGDILEILPVHDLPNAQYTWILTQDRTFIEASRSPTYRRRTIQPGTYTLFAEITSGDQSQRINRTFTLQYDPRIPTDPSADPPALGTGATALVTTDPPPDAQGRVLLPEGRSLLRLTPLQPDIAPIALDTDTQQDRDGDGNAANDVENDGTYFQTEPVPLMVWFTTPPQTRTLSLTAIGPDGAPVVQEITVLSERFAQEQGMVQSPVTIIAEERGEATFAFATAFSGTRPSAPLLHHWEFGNGQQSILPTPTHTYALPGTYTVTVRVQNLTNGAEIGRAQTQVTVEGVVAPPDGNGATDVPEVPLPDPPAPAGEGWSLPLGTILLVGGILGGILLLGLLMLAIVLKFRGRGVDLSDRIASMEESMLGKEDKKTPKEDASAAGKPAGPQPSEAASGAESLRRREEEHATANPLQEAPLKIEEGNAPAWLKSGLGSPAPSVPPPAPPPQAAPPPWLQQKAATTPANDQAPRTNSQTPPPPAPQPQTPPPAPLAQVPKPATPPANDQGASTKSQMPPPPAPQPLSPPQPPAASAPQPQPAQQPQAPRPPAPTPPVAEAPKPHPNPPPWLQQKPATPPANDQGASSKSQTPPPQASKPQEPKPATPPANDQGASTKSQMPPPPAASAPQPQPAQQPQAPRPPAPTPPVAEAPKPHPNPPPWLQQKAANNQAPRTNSQAPKADSPTPPQPAPKPQTPPPAPLAQVPKPATPPANDQGASSKSQTPPPPAPKPQTPPPAPLAQEPTQPHEPALQQQETRPVAPAPKPPQQANEQTNQRITEGTPSDDSPVAFIRAESIEEQNKPSPPIQTDNPA